MVGAKKKAGKKKPKKSFVAYGRLALLVEFLNLDVEHANPDSISGNLDVLIRLRGISSELRENLKSLQKELLQDLLPIAKLPVNRFKRSDKYEGVYRMNDHLAFLAKKISDMKFEVRLKIYSGQPQVTLSGNEFSLAVQDFPPEKPRAHLWGTVGKNPARRLINTQQGIFSWGIGKWIINMAFSAGHPYAPERDLYGIVAEGLMTGELSRLRQCGYCRTFFVAQQPRVTFCPGHARLYYDRPAQAKEFSRSPD